MVAPTSQRVHELAADGMNRAEQNSRTGHAQKRRFTMAQNAASGPAIALYQWLAFAIGVIYLTIGVAGFFVASPLGFAGHFTRQDVPGFAVDPLSNIVHLMTGFLGVILWSAPGGARTFGWVTAVVYGAMAAYGLVLLNSPGMGVIDVDGGMWLHVLSVMAGLAVALWPNRGGNVISRGHRPAR